MKSNKFISGAAIFLGLILAGCTSTSNNNNGNKVILSDNANSKLAVQSLSTLSLVNGDIKTNPLKRALLKPGDASSLTEQEIAEIKAILGQVDTILTNKTGVTSESIASTDEKYANGMRVTYTDIFNVSSTYEMFYNETTIIDEDLDDDETNDHDDKYIANNKHDDNDDDSDDDSEDTIEDEDNESDSEVETITSLEGILKSGEDTYNFASTVKEESEVGGQESEVNFKLFNDQGFFVKAVQEYEIEDNETESKIHYTIYDGKQVITNYTLKVEQEVGQNAEIRLVMDTKTYRIEQILADGEEFLKVKYMSGTINAHIMFKKVITTNHETQETTVDFVIVE